MIFEAWEMDREEAKEFDVRYHADAARRYGESILDDGEQWERTDVSVAVKGSDEVRQFTVRCRWEPVLTVSEDR